MRAVTHRISANGLSHFVRDSGDEDAPAALLMHGFPDSSAVWERVTPLLVNAGFRVIAPDMRGFGETDMATRTADYDIRSGAFEDMLGVLAELKIARAHLAGHDFGAVVAWMLAAQRPDVFQTLTAISVGHSRAFLNAGPEQKRRSLYILFHQFRGICEAIYRANDWAILRGQWTAHGDIDGAIGLLARPGRLTAGLRWYRANIPVARMIDPPKEGALGEERVKIPTLGLWSDGEKYLTEAQMIGSADFVDGPWFYQQITGASHWIPYDQPAVLSAALTAHWRKHG